MLDFVVLFSGGGATAGVPSIVLSTTSIDEDAAVGDLVGLLSVKNGSGAYAFTITTHTFFELDGVDDTRVEVKAALNYDTNASHTIEIQATGGTPELEQLLTISINPLARAAPTFAWADESTSDTTPAFTLGIPSGNGNYLDAIAGDTAEIAVDDVLWISHVLTPQNILDGTVALSGATELAEGARVGKARIVRAAGPASDYSATDSVTITAASSEDLPHLTLLVA